MRLDQILHISKNKYFILSVQHFPNGWAPLSDHHLHKGENISLPRETDATGPVGMSRRAADPFLALLVRAGEGSQILWFWSPAPFRIEEALSSSADPWSRMSIETEALPIPWLLVLPSFSAAVAARTSSTDLLRPFCCCWYSFHVSTFSMLFRARSPATVLGDDAPGAPAPLVPEILLRVLFAPSSKNQRYKLAAINHD